MSEITGAVDVPFRMTVCVDGEALSLATSVPLNAPVLVPGMKVIWTVQLDPAAIEKGKVVEQVPVPVFVNAPVTVRLETTRGLPPVLLKVVVCAALVVVRLVVNVKVVGEKLAIGAGLTPVPLSETVCVDPGIPPELFVNVSAPEKGPRAGGVNVTFTVQKAPGAIGVINEQLFV